MKSTPFKLDTSHVAISPGGASLFIFNCNLRSLYHNELAGSPTITQCGCSVTLPILQDAAEAPGILITLIPGGLSDLPNVIRLTIQEMRLGCSRGVELLRDGLGQIVKSSEIVSSL